MKTGACLQEMLVGQNPTTTGYRSSFSVKGAGNRSDRNMKPSVPCVKPRVPVLCLRQPLRRDPSLQRNPCRLLQGLSRLPADLRLRLRLLQIPWPSSLDNSSISPFWSNPLFNMEPGQPRRLHANRSVIQIVSIAINLVTCDGTAPPLTRI